MPKNILVDLNIILDVLLERKGHRAALQVLELSKTVEVVLYVSAHEVTTFSFLLEQAKVPRGEIKHHVLWLLNLFTVIATTADILGAATNSRLSDYEDAVIEQAAINCRAEAIITRNIKDFAGSAVVARTPEDFTR